MPKLTQQQYEELETKIRLAIAEDDTDIATVEHNPFDGTPFAALTNEGVDHLAALARFAVEIYLEELAAKEAGSMKLEVANVLDKSAL